MFLPKLLNFVILQIHGLQLDSKGGRLPGELLGKSSSCALLRPIQNLAWKTLQLC